MPAFIHIHTVILDRINFFQCLLLKAKEGSSSQINNLRVISALFSEYSMCVPVCQVSSQHGIQ